VLVLVLVLVLEAEVKVASPPCTTTSDISCDGVKITVVDVYSSKSAANAFLKLNWAITPM
jgi:hypothetical protein